MTKQEYLENIGYIMEDEGSYCKPIAPEGRYSYSDKEIHFGLKVPYRVCFRIPIITQEDIDVLQLAFNDVKKDFEEMQKYE